MTSPHLDTVAMIMFGRSKNPPAATPAKDPAPDPVLPQTPAVSPTPATARSVAMIGPSITIKGEISGEEDLLIQGTALGEGYDAAPGFIRAYNVRTGKIVWTFHTIPQPGEYGYDTWDTASYKEVGGVNAWAGMSLD